MFVFLIKMQQEIYLCPPNQQQQFPIIHLSSTKFSYKWARCIRKLIWYCESNSWNNHCNFRSMHLVGSVNSFSNVYNYSISKWDVWTTYSEPALFHFQHEKKLFLRTTKQIIWCRHCFMTKIFVSTIQKILTRCVIYITY